jgi:hypothetical protein
MAKKAFKCRSAAIPRPGLNPPCPEMGFMVTDAVPETGDIRTDDPQPQGPASLVNSGETAANAPFAAPRAGRWVVVASLICLITPNTATSVPERIFHAQRHPLDSDLVNAPGVKVKINAVPARGRVIWRGGLRRSKWKALTSACWRPVSLLPCRARCSGSASPSRAAAKPRKSRLEPVVQQL